MLFGVESDFITRILGNNMKLTSFYLILGLSCLSVSWLSAGIFGLDFLGRKAERVEQQRVEKKLWSKPEGASFTDKSFPIKEWSKHYSGLGVKRAPITMSEKDSKKRYEVSVLDQKKVEFELSRWNDKLSDLHKRAGIQMDDRAGIAADHRLYNAMMGEARQYRELGEKLAYRISNAISSGATAHQRRSRPSRPAPVSSHCRKKSKRASNSS